MRILVADDDLTSQMIAGGALEKCGHEVIIAQDGLAAVETLLKPDAPRIAVLDWNMPGIDGCEVCRRIRSVQTDNPPYLIILTTRCEKKDIVEGLSAGADDYLGKPFNIEELNARVEVGNRVLALQERLSIKVKELQQALHDIKTLSGFLPICAWCKKIRDDQGYWEQLERYITQNTNALFTHSVCPECAKTILTQEGLR